MTRPAATAPAAVDEPLGSNELAVADLLSAAHLLASHQLPGLLAERRLGVTAWLHARTAPVPAVG